MNYNEKFSLPPLQSEYKENRLILDICWDVDIEPSGLDKITVSISNIVALNNWKLDDYINKILKAQTT